MKTGKSHTKVYADAAHVERTNTSRAASANGVFTEATGEGGPCSDLKQEALNMLKLAGNQSENPTLLTNFPSGIQAVLKQF